MVHKYIPLTQGIIAAYCSIGKEADIWVFRFELLYILFYFFTLINQPKLGLVAGTDIFLNHLLLILILLSHTLEYVKVVLHKLDLKEDLVSFLTEWLNLRVELLDADFIPHVDPLFNGLPLEAKDLQLAFLNFEFFNDLR